MAGSGSSRAALEASHTSASSADSIDVPEEVVNMRISKCLNPAGKSNDPLFSGQFSRYNTPISIDRGDRNDDTDANQLPVVSRCKCSSRHITFAG